MTTLINYFIQCRKDGYSCITEPKGTKETLWHAINLSPFFKTEFVVEYLAFQLVWEFTIYQQSCFTLLSKLLGVSSGL
jgi:hypothetical protein